ncbi:type VI immunity family protein [Corallococcus sp. AS-1-6]|uniref:type VI immunity family protein n=1 Tax=Corallococcus sp. AS-1-6 TaxID=2874599 RepID=UPI001CBD5D6B|nr:type VI immunity family protein [Corallococcus sp. AS-1-6]MBZ4375023.1 DUF3396 domain-containing protein [Corallococcus sp. AS-1-6]
MAVRFPRVQTTLNIEGEEVTILREGLRVVFYMPGFHEEVMGAVTQALDRYLHALELESLGWYLDYDGYWWALAEEEPGFLQRKLMDPRGASIEARGRPDSVTGIRFSYVGHSTIPALFARDFPQPMCAVEFWLPTGFLETRGNEAVRSLIVELGRGLPFSSGHAGPALEAWSWGHHTTPILRDRSARHPGFDLPGPGLGALASYLGTKLRPPAWLTFLGPPVLNELGGAEALRSRLHSPSTRVEALSPERAVVSLGPVPEAGDLEAGDTLPAYRELARVLEPWLYAHKGSWGDFTEAEVRQWERRFL